MNDHRSTRSLRRRTASLAAGVALALAATSCGTSTSSAPEVIAVPSTAVAADADRPTAPPSTTDAPAPSPEPDVAHVVRLHGDGQVHDEPVASSPSHTVPARTEHGSPTALLVTDRRAGWVQVLVPGRPTGATGWLADDELEVVSVALEVRVDLAARTLTLVDGDRQVLSTSVAVGAPDTPTPVGRFSVTDKLDTQAPSGPYGRYAIGLSGRSEVLTEFAGGDGQIGIHGTNDPASIGHDVSHGCIRVPNEVMEQLNALLPLGTPVVVS
ncbi:MAG: L,D-transpeptidase [Actinobacteria bacterium]|nr:L,D-transpeptidase [Actinomycetota bacterium]